ncbi:MAG: exopolysaccharide biosynthesis protein [Alphaproteobacteria bacterium]
MTLRSISELFEQDFLGVRQEQVSLAYIIKAVHERGFGFILFFIALPMALPIPVPPGVNILLATPLLLLTAQQMIGRHTIWLPRRVLNKTMPREKFTKMIAASIPWIKRLEFFIRPRLGFITQGLFSNLIGLCGLIMALSICVPLPLTNTVPSLGIALMGIGVVMRDGLAVLGGAIIGLAWVAALCYFALIFGTEGLDMMKEAIKSLL